MSEVVRVAIEDQIHMHLQDAAEALAWKAHVEKVYPWRRHDSRIYAERAEVALQAVKHLEAELA